MYGLTDDLVAESNARREAVDLLLAVAKGKKTVAYVRTWLEVHYPKLCTKTTTRKKW